MLVYSSQFVTAGEDDSTTEENYLFLKRILAQLLGITYLY